MVAGHFKVQPGCYPGSAVMHGTPVGHDQTAKPPAAAQNIGEQYFIFAAIGAIQPVISAHHGIGLALFYRNFKRPQISFVQGALVDDGANGHAPLFLVIHRKMFE
ncbi:hypothetical protein SDC9_180873 [bioreactor metagenome]|uniref:Uncharacterized protein n=1 Tax=bioreactor metagenome TaxID=1076179 RepID=A0A645H2Z6_9ZZZZ